DTAVTWKNIDPATVKYGKDGSFSFTTPDKFVVEINPFTKSEKLIDGNTARVKYFGSNPHDVMMEKDKKGNWGVTQVRDGKGIWDFKYKGDSRDEKDLAEVTCRGLGAKRQFKIGEGGVDGLTVTPQGDLTVQFKPGEKYLSSTFKPGTLEEVHKAP